MRDEPIVEVIAEVFRAADHETPFDKSYAGAVLAALRDAGYDVYRVEDASRYGADHLIVPVGGDRDA